MRNEDNVLASNQPFSRYIKRVRAGGGLLLSSARQLVGEEWLGKMRTLKPTVIQFPVNDICNAQCVMCNIWRQKKDKEITPDELRTILADSLFTNVRYVGMSGGEPTLRSDLAELGRSLVECLPKLRGVGIITNAIPPRMAIERISALAQVVRGSNLSFNVNVSLDGVGEVHDAHRGVKGNFAAAVTVIGALQSEGIPVSIGCTLTPLNCHHADDVLMWCEQNGIRDWEFRLGVDIKRVYNEGYSDQRPFTPEQRFHVINFFDTLTRHPQVNQAHRRFYRSLVGQLAFRHHRTSGCVWQSRGVTLDTRGNISYCSVQSPILGSALDTSAWQIYKGGVGERERIIRDHCDQCQHDLLGSPSPRESAKEGVKMVIEPWLRQWDGLRKRVNVAAGGFQAPRSILPPDRSMPSQWEHVLITGWYGTETAGDKAILAELIHFLNNHAPGCKITLTTLNHVVSQQTTLEIPGCETVSYIDMDQGHNPSVIETVDAVIIGGGPLEEIEQTEHIWRMFLEANRQRKARILFGCGVGLLYSERIRMMVDAICQMATAGFFRDEESLDYALEVGAAAPLKFACDPALAYVQRWVDRCEAMSQEQQRPLVAALLRANTGEYIRDMDPKALETFNLGTAQSFARILEEVGHMHQAQVDLLAMHAISVGGDDRVFNRQVAACFKDSTTVRVERRYLTLESLLHSLRAADIGVAMRYHGHLFCMALGVPFLSIDYTGKQGKINNLMRRINYAQWSYGWRVMDVDQVRSRLQQLFEERSHWSEYLRRQAMNLVGGLNETYVQTFNLNESSTTRS